MTLERNHGDANENTISLCTPELSEPREAYMPSERENRPVNSAPPVWGHDLQASLPQVSDDRLALRRDGRARTQAWPHAIIAFSAAATLAWIALLTWLVISYAAELV
jgi:hypothetical protein